MSTKVMPKEKTKYAVPGYFAALKRMCTAEFLELRDDDNNNSLEQYNGELVNLALVGALLFTTFMPLYFSEPSRISPDSTDAIMDILRNSYWNRSISVLDFDLIHDWLDCSYLLASSGMFLCTLSCVYLIIMLNEAGTNERVILFRRKLGIYNRFPYYFFSLGALGFSLFLAVHLPLTALTLPGFLIKITLCCIVPIFIFAFILIPKACQSLYNSFHEVEIHHETALSSYELQEKLKHYFLQVENDTKEGYTPNYLLEDYISSLKLISAQGYSIPLTQSTKLEAVQLFYSKFAARKDMSVQELFQWLECCKQQ